MVTGSYLNTVHSWLLKPTKYVLVILIVMAAFLGIAAIVLFPPGKDQGGTDNWWPIVLNIANGKGYISCQTQYFPFCEHALQESASREPVPLLLFAFLAKISNNSLVAAVLLNVFIFIGILVATYLIANMLRGPGLAALAGLAWVLYVPAYRLIPQIAGDLMATLWFSWGIYFFLRGLRESGMRYWVGAGLLFGLAAMSRSVLLFVAGALLAGLFVSSLIRKNHHIKHALITGVIMLLCIMPWAIRNLTVFGFPLIGTTLSGYNLYRHNGLIESDSWLHYASPKEGEALVAKLLQTVPTQGTENEYQMNEIFTKEASRIIRAYPQRYVMLSLYRFLPLWFDIGINEAYQQSRSALDWIVIALQLLLLISSILGLKYAWRSTWPLWLSILVVNIMHMAVNARIRFMIVVMPLLLIYSTIIATKAIERLSYLNKSQDN